LNFFPHERFGQLVYKENINATFVASCNTTNVRDLDGIVPLPSTQINAKRISTTRIYFAFFRGIHLLCWYMFIINATRSCNERTILHCVESYLYYIILVNNFFFLRSETREKINKQYTYIVENIKFIYTSFDEFFLPVSQRT
jgi:hypothetical protein